MLSLAIMHVVSNGWSGIDKHRSAALQHWTNKASSTSQFTYASHIQRIPRNGSSSADSSEKVAGGAVDSSTESAEQSLDLQLDEIKRNLTTGLPPEAAALIDGIVENVRNMSTDSLKTAGAVRATDNTGISVTQVKTTDKMRKLKKH